jgi:1-acyl-sn-glycerol-3-phosphate acyltransferase
VVRRHSDKPGPYLRFCVILVYPLINLLWRRRWINDDRIPTSGPAIIAVNHISYADPFVIARCVWDVGRVPRFLAKADLFTIPVIGRIFTGAGQIPVHRGTADADRALSDAVAALDRGEMVLIYPEGTVTRDPDFWPMRAKTGVARLALLAPGVPVVPVGQWGAQNFLDFYARKFRPLPRKAVALSVGEPVDLREFAGSSPTAEVLRAMTDKVMAAVREQVAEIRGEVPPADFYPRPTDQSIASHGADPARSAHRDQESAG